MKLFKLLLQKDTDKNIISQSLKHFKPVKIEPNLKVILDSIPNATGVFYIYNSSREIIYIGKSKNIKKRVTQLFTGSNKKSKEIQKQVADVTFEKTGNELISILKEFIEVRKHEPFLNGKIKRTNFSHGLYVHTDEQDQPTLQVKSAVKDPNYILSFSSSKSGTDFLEKIEEDKSPQDVIAEIKEKYSIIGKSKIIVDRGREASERSVILVEQGKVIGYAFVNLRIQMTDTSMLKSLLTPMDGSKQVTHIISSYLRHKRVHQVIDL